jgi:hypothetical protein
MMIAEGKHERRVVATLGSRTMLQRVSRRRVEANA